MSGTLVIALSSFRDANGLAVVCALLFGVSGAVVSAGGASKDNVMVVFSGARPADFVFCIICLLFWVSQFILRNRAQGPSQTAHDVIFLGFVMVLCRFVLVSAGFAGFCLFFYDFELVSACLAAFCVVLC